MSTHHSVSPNEKTWGTFVHLSAFLAFFIPFLGSILGPLIIWLIQKNSMPFVNNQGRQALNFNISITLYLFVAAIFAKLSPLIVILNNINHEDYAYLISQGFIYLFIFGLIWLTLFFFWLINVIRAAISANKGILFKYPLSIPFL